MKARDIQGLIAAGNLSLPPVEFGDIQVDDDRTVTQLRACWNKQKWRFAVEVRARSTPKTIAEATRAIQGASLPRGTYPLLVVPYLSEEELNDLVARNVSAVDLSGNGVLVVPGQLLVFRSGKPNRYPEKSALKNVYRGKSSVAARVFLLRPRYRAVNEIRDEIRSRGAELAISTVSKVLARLEEDLIVSRSPGEIRLVQARRLLDVLAQNYEAPGITKRLAGKTKLDITDFAIEASVATQRPGFRIVPTGVSSLSAYAVMARPGPTSFYCTDIQAFQRDSALAPIFEETERFANVQLEETRDDLLYFDIRREGGALRASPLQTYLELMSGDKRDRETAAQVAEGILKKVA
jgi:hypothetical protein